MRGDRVSWLSSLRLGARALTRELPGLSPAVLIVVLLLCLLLPLPTVFVDLLLSLSLAGALLLLVACLRVARATEFLSFPTLVLLLTLFRLALNVSTTRLILSQADAGRVIDAFAELVVRGDLLVGAVMFGIISAIQYLVIARGAERVAEVAARFALDSMPGQQAAIDADLRNQTIGPREARARRAALSERSELLGRMDGVMRWVRGDAIVGLVITGSNLVGGLAAGSRLGLGVGESLELYGKLAIGDGLLAQLPALLIALAAALLVARVDRVGEQQQARWLEPSMLLIPALLLGLLAAVPGMPTLAFATCAAGLLAVALWVSSREPDSRAHTREPEIHVRAHVERSTLAVLARDLADVRRRCEQALAIPVPRLVLEPLGPTSALAFGELELRLGERVLGRSRSDAVHDGDTLMLGCFHVLMNGAERLITLEQIEAELEAARRRHPTLVRQALRVLEPIDVLAIERAFVRERIPVPHIDVLIEALAERRVFHDPNERRYWPEHAREALADHWLRDLCDAIASAGERCWVRPSADFEDALLARAQISERGVTLGLSPVERAEMLERLCHDGRDAEPARVVVCSSRARAGFAALLAGVRPYVPVLSIGEFSGAGIELPPCRIVDVE